MKILEVESPNYTTRFDAKAEGEIPKLCREKIQIALHEAHGPTGTEALKVYLDGSTGLGCHYLIDTDGTVYHLMVDEYIPAGYLDKVLAVGVVVDGCPDAQIEGLLDLLTDLCFTHRIPLNQVNGFAGKDFPWYEFLNTLGAKLSEREFAED